MPTYTPTAGSSGRPTAAGISTSRTRSTATDEMAMSTPDISDSVAADRARARSIMTCRASGCMLGLDATDLLSCLLARLGDRGALGRDRRVVANGLRDERRHIDDQCHASVAQNRCARQAWHVADELAERLDDDLLLADET